MPLRRGQEQEGVRITTTLTPPQFYLPPVGSQGALVVSLQGGECLLQELEYQQRLVVVVVCWAGIHRHCLSHPPSFLYSGVCSSLTRQQVAPPFHPLTLVVVVVDRLLTLPAGEVQRLAQPVPPTPQRQPPQPLFAALLLVGVVDPCPPTNKR